MNDFLKSVVGRVSLCMTELMTRAKNYMGVDDYLDLRRANERMSHRRDEVDKEKSVPQRKRGRLGQKPNTRAPTH